MLKATSTKDSVYEQVEAINRHYATRLRELGFGAFAQKSVYIFLLSVAAEWRKKS